MSNPWDRPPLPTAGDLDPDKTCAGVGRVTSQWECIEFGLCRLCSVFLSDPDGEAMRFYGEKRSFQARLEEFAKTVEPYFIPRCNQNLEINLEIQLHQIIAEANAFVDRRNDVAHGTVFQINLLDFYRTRLTRPEMQQYAVIPPYHMIRSHGDDGFPLYGYTHETLLNLVQQMEPLRQRIIELRECLLRLHPHQRP
jgi:hypothetical protein